MSERNPDQAAVLSAQPHSWAVHRARFALTADWLAVAVAVALPWSTSASGILVGLWLLMLAPTLQWAELRRIAVTAAGGLPIALVALALIGMAWADVPLKARFSGLESFLKLLAIPLLLIQYAASPRGGQVGLGFLVSAAVLMVFSWVFFYLDVPPWYGKDFGVPTNDRIFLSEMFVICAFCLAPIVIEAWRAGERLRAPALAALITAFFLLNAIFVTTARTTFVVMVVLALMLGWRHAGRRGFLVGLGIAAILATGALSISPKLRDRVMTVKSEVTETLTTGRNTSAGARMVFWVDSIELMQRRPVLGHGTGSIREAFRSLNPAAEPASNPHNQILATGIQLGLVGVAVLLLLWYAHLELFRGGGLIVWFGLVMVVQNVVASLFNSHLFDYGQGWLYVFGVGVLGGTAMRQRSADASARAP